MLCRLSYKASQCVGQELNLHSQRGWVTATWARQCPADTCVRVPWMGFEPMLSTSRAWRPLRTGPPGHMSVAQGGVEPPASLLLEAGVLPVAYRASRPPRCQRAIGQSVRRESNPPVRRGEPEPGPISHGHIIQRKERESNPQGSSLVRVRAGCRRQSACPSVSVWMAGFEPAWSGFRRQRMMPGAPTSSFVSYSGQRKRPGVV